MWNWYNLFKMFLIWKMSIVVSFIWQCIWKTCVALTESPQYPLFVSYRHFTVTLKPLPLYVLIHFYPWVKDTRRVYMNILRLIMCKVLFLLKYNLHTSNSHFGVQCWVLTNSHTYITITTVKILNCCIIPRNSPCSLVISTSLSSHSP